MEENSKNTDINALLSGAFREVRLRQLFEKRLHELGMSQTAAEKEMKISRRTLNGILDGTQKRANISGLENLSVFLNIPIGELIELQSPLIEKNFADQDTSANKKKFIKENFDLAVLRKAGFIKNIVDFEDIEKTIVSFFGFSSIFEYRKRSFDTAFWAGAIVPKKTTTRDFWLTAAKSLAIKIDNPYPYNRSKLVSYFPQIRWNSMNEELGFINVIKALFTIGITVIFQPRLSALHLRGATFAVNNKPCIALTDYKGFYPTLWHCLIHELYHVLFDWEDINSNVYSYHLSEDTEGVLTLDEKEIEADDFAHKYLFSKEKMEEVKYFIYNRRHVEDVAKENNVHASIIHSYYAYEISKNDRMAWVRARRFMPDVKRSVYRLENAWNNSAPLDEVAKKLKLEIYN